MIKLLAFSGNGTSVIAFNIVSRNAFAIGAHTDQKMDPFLVTVRSDRSAFIDA